MNKWTSVLLLTAVMIVGSLVLVGCGGSTATETPASTGEAPEISAPVQSGGRIVAEGEVIPISDVVLSFSTSGVVEEVYVNEGDIVEVGQVIARLEGKERLTAAVTAAEMAVLQAQQALDKLHEDAEVRKSEAQLALAKAETAYDDAKEDLDRIDWTHGDQEKIDGAFAAWVLAKRRADDAKVEYDAVAFKPDDDEEKANKLTLYAEAREERDQAFANLDYLRSTPDAFDVAEAEAEVEVTKANLEKAKLDWEELQDGLDADDLELAETRLKEAKAQLEAANANLLDLELDTPFSGTVVKSDLKAGELAGPTTGMVTLADLSGWKIETTDLTELNVVDIQEGDSVLVTFDALPDLELSGTVEKINAMGENKQGDITYTIEVSLNDMDQRLRWKMTAFVAFK